MIAAIAGLLLCQLVGEVIVRTLMLPVPGPVLGMGLMFAFLLVHGHRPQRQTPEGSVPQDLGRVCDTLLGNLSLLFVPAAVGIVQYLELLRRLVWPIALTVAVSTTATLIVTALVFRLVSRLHAFRRQGVVGDIEAAFDRERRP